jgi:hypothetical protein
VGSPRFAKGINFSIASACSPLPNATKASLSASVSAQVADLAATEAQRSAAAKAIRITFILVPRQMSLERLFRADSLSPIEGEHLLDNPLAL